MSYPKGCVVLCDRCFRPIYALERGIGPEDKAGRAVSAFRPLTGLDLDLLQERDELDGGWRLLVRDWRLTEGGRRVLGAARPRAGEEMRCPCCGEVFVSFVPVEDFASEHDRGYRVQLVVIPPAGRAVLPSTRWRDLSEIPVEARES